MAGVYSTRLYAGTIPIGSTDIYDAPAGYRVVVRDIQMSSSDVQSVPPAPLKLYLWFPGRVLLTGVRGPYPQFARTYSWQGRVVMNPNDFIQAVTTSGGWEVIISGYLLTLP